MVHLFWGVYFVLWLGECNVNSMGVDLLPLLPLNKFRANWGLFWEYIHRFGLHFFFLVQLFGKLGLDYP